MKKANTNPDKARSEKKRQELLSDQHRLDMSVVMRSREGRRYILKLLTDCGIFRISFNKEGMDSETFFNEGMRNIGLKVLNDLDDACPDMYFLAKKENKEERNAT